MHIKQKSIENDIAFTAWCGVKVGGMTRAYLTVDNALKAIQARVGSYPCQECLRAISDQLQDELDPGG